MATEAIIALAAGLAVMGAGIGAALSIGKATTKAVEATARQPEAGDKILRILILGASLVEATAIYALVVALLLIFVK